MKWAYKMAKRLSTKLHSYENDDDDDVVDNVNDDDDDGVEREREEG